MKETGKYITMRICDISTQYQFQGPRFMSLGKASGEEFRNKELIPWIKELGRDSTGIIDFKGTIVYSPSFLEESFGVAVRLGYKEQVSKLQFINIEEMWLEKLKCFISDAVRNF